ncbi:DUF1120 domain-containing protein [Pseudomonas sp. FP453]|jgi:hypothetical protein|uniref:DUF1120 domain-containing protein n=1 Tax=Pseudomonas sp. FP453 TaxID=2954094 RepID=UPI0027376F37|nr:DUF1120 domain-containing protein [Pseudomonas sp. FP453]WLH91389.1 DUF1120 domain-containing protein [Pseudomonas sp. FP453]
MRNTRNLLALALMVAGAGHAVAASSVDLSVKGSITPSACTPEMSNGGVYDMGKLSAKDLKVTSPTRLPTHTMPFKVTCESDTLMALYSQDNRAGSAYNYEAVGGFGLGLINGNQKLGLFYAYFESPTVNGAPAMIIESFDGGPTWREGDSLRPTSLMSFANTSVLAPIPGRLFAADMIIAPFIAPTNSLTLTEEVPIDGSVTVTVKYL